MEIKSSKDLSTLYGPNQTGPKNQPEKMERPQGPASGGKLDTVSLSAEALRKQAETKKMEDEALKDSQRTRQQQSQPTAQPTSTRNMATQRIDLMA